ncbi:cytochrome P450 [Aulographum hederae CBS 113979]|uniref:Cytochrome P450 n=1 Tax=Aulographum hederae CBS 113979 TaxID=1176131 RepID=A0A6G1HBL3_9PEZI|nr:cytochrome P450 [Aulographum hederae CBS 113979]
MYLYVLAVGFALLAVQFSVQVLRSYTQLPKGTRWLPGPKGLPLIGRVWDIPRNHSYKRFKVWSDKFGPIYQMNIFGYNHIWIASDKIATDLLSRKSQYFSDRPPINNLNNSKDAPEYLPLLGYNDIWKRQRKFVHGVMSHSVAEHHHNVPYQETKQYLVDLLQNPTDHERIAESFTGRVISRLAFGDVRFDDDLRTHSHALLHAISPAANLPNIVPQLRLLPYYLSPWKMAESARHDRERAFFVELFNAVDQQIKDGKTEPSYMRTFFENRGKSGMSDLEGSYVIGMVGLAGILTTASALMTYILAMCLYPEWQVKLQEEVDRVCGDRMPEPKDAPQMPVLRAVIKEIMRWRPVTPSSIPHESTEDFVYEGYFIPKGTHIHPSQWAITRDTTTYPDPDTYNPARWLDPAYPTYQFPLTKYPTIQNFTTFGYGRRICMGMDLVEQELLVGVGGMAWAFNISKKRDEATGKDVEIASHDYTSLLISRPRAFEFEMVPRSREREELVWEGYDEAVRTGEIGGRKGGEGSPRGSGEFDYSSDAMREKA